MRFAAIIAFIPSCSDRLSIDLDEKNAEYVIYSSNGYLRCVPEFLESPTADSSSNSARLARAVSARVSSVDRVRCARRAQVDAIFRELFPGERVANPNGGMK